MNGLEEVFDQQGPKVTPPKKKENSIPVHYIICSPDALTQSNIVSEKEVSECLWGIWA